MAHYMGTDEDDAHNGTAASDYIEGAGGDDTLYDGPRSAASVADQIFGDVGDDVIATVGGADTVDGGSNRDQLIIDYELIPADFFLAIAEDTGNSITSSNGLSITSIEIFEFHLGSGNDNVSAGAGDDRFYGNGGNDAFFGKSGSDVAFGGIGEDHFFGGSGGDALYGEADDDLLYGDGGNDGLLGGIGDDELHGGTGDDFMTGDAGADQLHGDGGNDRVYYSQSSVGVTVNLAAHTGDNGDAEGDTYDSIETVYGSTFDDTLTGSGEFESLYGEAGNDILRGGAGADLLYGGVDIDTASYFTGAVGVTINLLTGIGSGGGAQGDRLSSIENLSGSQGHDSLVGNSDDNVLRGWNGNDLLTGAGGKDTLSGGIGGDRFVYGSVGQSVVGADADRITDFSHAQADKIDLAAIDANSGAAGNQAFSFIGTGLYTGVAGQLRYAQSGGVTTIAGDVDGNGTSDFHIQLTGAVALAAGDFVL
ncbi:Ca2+-binding RTX toxin-like protein [Inquilinus ginsengisoli]|uniref:calcium-binding protein n=1 Tax=Inquilinus ginsengisoli TaxID=363840 RepID=UPI003D1E4190